MARRCKRCGAPMGGIVSIGKVKESEKRGVCINCFDKKEKKEVSKADKRKEKKLRKAWLFER